MVPNWYIVQTICWNVQISRELSIIQTLNQKWTSILFSWETIFKNCKNVKLVPLRGSGERVRIQCTFLDSWTVVCHRHNGQSPSRGKFLATQICRSFFYFIFSRTRSKVCLVSVLLFSLFLALLQSGSANLLSVTTLFLSFDNFSMGDLSHLHQYLKYREKRKICIFLWVKRVCVELERMWRGKACFVGGEFIP